LIHFPHPNNTITYYYFKTI